MLRDRTLAKMTPEEWDTVIRVHLRGHYAPTHAALVHWREHGGPGHVVCTASTSGLLGNFGQSNYGAAKAGIAAFAQIVAQETARMGVTCNAIAPAARTRMTEGAYGEIFGAARATSTSGTRTTWRRWSRSWSATRPRTSAARCSACRATRSSSTSRGRRWPRSRTRAAGGTRRRSPGRIGVLFAEADMEPGATNGMARLRYTMTNRG